MRIATRAHAVFAAAMVALGVIGLVHGEYAGVWQQMPRGLVTREVLTCLCALVSIASGAGLLWERTVSVATRVLLGWLLLWLLLFRVRYLLLAPASQDSWSGWGETAVMVSGAWVLYACFAAGWDRRNLAFATGASGLRIARLIFGIALIPFGIAHFAYIKQTAALVPAWLPAHLFFAYFTGCAFIAAAFAVLTGFCAKLASALTAVQLGLFTLLVWLPIMAARPRNAFKWSETVISAALTAAAWVVAESYRNLRPMSRTRSHGDSVVNHRLEESPLE